VFSAVNVIDTVLHIFKDTTETDRTRFGWKVNRDDHAMKPSRPPGMDLEVAM